MKSGKSAKSIPKTVSTHDAESVRSGSKTTAFEGKSGASGNCSYVLKTRVDAAGRLLIPVKVRRALNIRPRDSVYMALKGQLLEISTLDNAIDEAQSIVRKYVAQDRSLVDELIAERRMEAKQE